ncbi:MAG: metalloregulator ArsR/SmtB family transcription factor [Cyanobacteria bacterium P01_A01_bin.135]
MQSTEAIARLLALGQPTRLAAYRLLVEHEPVGLPVTEIAQGLGVNLSTLSRHLAQMERAGLLQSSRHDRQVFYRCSATGLEDLVTFLTENCCGASAANAGSCHGESKTDKRDRKSP